MYLRARLAVFFALLVGTTLAFSGMATYKLMRIGLLSEIERDVARRGAVFAASPPGTPYQLDVFAAPDIFLQVVTRDGWPIASSGNLGGRILPLTSHMRAGNVVEARVNARPLYLTAAPLGPDRYIVVARSPRTIYGALRTLRRLLYGVTAGGLFIVGFLSWFFARTALRPVEEVAAAAQQVRGSRDLRRRVAYEGPRDELGRLVATFNEMLTELERAYAQLDESNQQLRRFLADVAHELRAPLTLITSNVELLRKIGEGDAAFARRAIDDILTETSRMARMITQLLILGRADAGTHITTQPLLLADVVSGAVRQAQTMANGTALRLVDESALDGVAVRGNDDYLRQLFLILLDNAVKYSASTREVSVEAEVRAGAARVAVVDVGPGIDPGDLPHIFERFTGAIPPARSRAPVSGWPSRAGLSTSTEERSRWSVHRVGAHALRLSCPSPVQDMKCEVRALTRLLRCSGLGVTIVRYDHRMRACLLVLGTVLIGVLAAHAAPAGLPGSLAGYQSWTKMNGRILDDPSNLRAGPKNSYTTLTPEVLRALVGAGARLRAPFPEGTIVARETLDVTAGFVRILFVMEKDGGATATRGWRFSAFSRTGADQAFQRSEIQDPVTRCLNCHLQMGATDFVFTPFLNRPDPLPGRTPTAPDRVEIFNYRFAPQTLRVRPGTMVAFSNFDAIGHDVKAADRSFESGNLPVLGRFFHTFDRPGAVDYFCAVHLEMRARIIVEP